MAIRHNMTRLVVVVVAFVAALAMLSVATPAAHAAGQCGGAVKSWKGYYNNLSQYPGAVQQAAQVNQSAGYSPTDGSFKQWLSERVIVAPLAESVTIENYGCNSGGLFPAGPKTLSKGWPVLVALPDKYDKKDVRLKPCKGCKRITITVALVGQATCANPGKARVKIHIWIKKSPKKTKVNLLKKVTGGSYAGTFTFKVKVGSKPARTIKVRPGRKYSLGTLKRGTRVKVTEVAVPGGWKVVGSRTQTKTVRGGTLTFTFVNKKKGGCGGCQPPPCQVTNTCPVPPGGCNVIIGGDNNGNVCGGTQVCVANGSYSGNPSLCQAYMNCIAVQGNTWNSTQNVCVTPPSDACPNIPGDQPPGTDCNPPPPTPKPSASAALQCPPGGSGGVDVTLRNDATATAPAAFTVNGTSYGPIAPGGQQTVTVSVAEDSDVRVVVKSGTATLLDQTFHRDCSQPPPPNTPPVVSFHNPPQHVCSGQTTSGGSVTPGQITLVVLASDPDGDNLGTPQVTALRGTLGVPTKVADGQWTVRYTAPATAGNDTVTARVADGHDHNGDGQVNNADAVFVSITFANPLVDLNNPSPTTC